MNDTIGAVSTALLNSAIGIIRISGPGVLHTSSSLLHKNGKKLETDYLKANARRALKCDFGNPHLDQIVFVYYADPNSYTGEDMAEFFFHGNVILMKKALSMIFDSGVRPAERGEFTKRAYLSGKLDITCAEAVHRVITARSGYELELAQKNLFGETHRLVSRLRSDIIGLKAECEAEIDFSTEDLTFESLEERKKRMQDVISLCDKTLRNSERAESVFEKRKIVIFGEPNAGKSSLLNLLLGKERAIVSPIPGTTRDFLSEDMDLRGIPLRLVDTAGIRDTEDQIEKAGIEKSRKEFDSADIRVAVFDTSVPFNEKEIQKNYNKMHEGTVFVLNKSDIMHKSWNADRLKSALGIAESAFISVSCTQRTGIEELLEEIHERMHERKMDPDFVFLEDRNRFFFRMISESVKTALELFNTGAPSEIYVQDINRALSAIGKIQGKADTEEILGRIFSKFCVGK
ncbi:MAG TPA: tRNA uridine-5-carboxymethylaminomethyl(34) synthesis GTPase MnmE [Leptospiraceae bacterium]|nr:tRNA uridine-5-carboxymethylaminomethyl(34) synthesis GTPase MnmE [Leptospiraceae bacterium]HNF13968.1 tRNA uridine-5-carboxymethylaminomethyl(34) synthesis GTPase MnmE [Leptospiraceae bacterium]HNI96692.1 tRNA uridine-5-carboxymethylaminomethyl(34) synthesis GTPase MnmE [Leptospiraceae bacterium]HNN04986.1 tRNA uridine-5-carboxymethylaminomethyl(34) synthesis GTPase MnmE [Leptospiraceae bacterium]